MNGSTGEEMKYNSIASSESNTYSELYFVHGTSIDSTIWNLSIVKSIGELFGHDLNQGHVNLIDWSGANNTKARKEACARLIEKIEYRKNEINFPLKKITIIGHSHGGTVVLYASNKIRAILGSELEINILTLNTPNVQGGAKLEDLSIKHYHVYCKSDEVSPRAGFNKTGLLVQGGERKNWLGKPIGGEYSIKKDIGSGKAGSTIWKFDSALINIEYLDQYRFKGLNPRTHFVSHRGWLLQNVNEWLPKLQYEMQLLIK